MYLLKLIPWMITGAFRYACGLRRLDLVSFVNGWQDLWEKIARRFDVHCNADILAINRTTNRAGAMVEIVRGNETEAFDRVIISCLLNNVHSFILYFNVYDYVFTPSFASQAGYLPLRLRDYLGHLLHARGFEVVIYYSLAGGLSYLDETVMGPRITKSIPEKLAGIHPNLAHYTFRHACGLPPVPQFESVSAWLRQNSADFASIVDADLRTGNQTVLDLSVGSLFLGGDGDGADLAAVTEKIFRQLQAANAAVGIGRYNEAIRNKDRDSKAYKEAAQNVKV